MNAASISLFAAFAFASLVGCPSSSTPSARALDASATDATPPMTIGDAASTKDAPVAIAEPVTREIGPFEVPFERDRVVYYVASRVVPAKDKPARLLANLHGMCNPPGYACGYWTGAGANAGFLICPQGNARCGNSPKGSPTWTETIPQMDADLEKAIAMVDARHPGEIGREGSILTGFSMGAAAAYQIARAHPGRWPYLVLVESDVALDKKELEKAGVRSVALLAGEIGSQVAGEKRTAERLAKQGYPARLWIMKGAGHHYSADIDDLMAEAVAYVLGHDADAGP